MLEMTRSPDVKYVIIKNRNRRTTQFLILQILREYIERQPITYNALLSEFDARVLKLRKEDLNFYPVFLEGRSENEGLKILIDEMKNWGLITFGHKGVDGHKDVRITHFGESSFIKLLGNGISPVAREIWR